MVLCFRAMSRVKNEFKLRISITSIVILFVVLLFFLPIMIDWLEDEPMNSSATSERVMELSPNEPHKYLTTHARNVSRNERKRYGTPINISRILRLIHKYNDDQTIYNEDIFGPVQNDTLIIAVQVHTRVSYLRHLIVSLAQARDIGKTILVFSHDYYDEEINALIRSINFTKVMQLFFPYSIQTHPNEFPGEDPNDCPRELNPDQAVKLKCNNALHPDAYGHYREAKYTQTKHHWWWKANRIFNQLQATKGHTGMVLFLEEDHYVAEDFIHMMKLLRSTADKSCPQCNILSLGVYIANFRYPRVFGTKQTVEITSSMLNMCLAFNRTVWNNIMELHHQFCEYDDYNWDFSLLHLSQNRPNRQMFRVMLCRGPRVFHIGLCGLHNSNLNCNASIVISKLLKNANDYSYPTGVTITVTVDGAVPHKILFEENSGNGGWSDPRDQQLCTNMTKVGRENRENGHLE
ncbi:hypothetical protein O0L34_g1092 [Tuta absoluta]|nr:hypothetical protein O0L34_g1092 [Tuta absoluta]